MSSWSLHGWAIFCCTVASLGLIGALFAALAFTSGKGVFAFLNGSRAPTVIVVNGGGQYVQPPAKRGWGFGRFYGLFAAIFSGGPMLTLLVMGVVHLFWSSVAWTVAHWWVLPVVLVAALVVGVFWLLIRRDATSERQERAQLAALPAHAPAPPVAAQPIWTAPELERNWSERN